MKVLLVNKFHYKKGGSETYYFTLAEAFKKNGHEVIFFAMKDEKNIPCEQEKYFVSNASKNGGLKSKLNMIMHIVYSKEAYKNMKKLLEDEKPDLVILNLVHKQITCSIIDAIKEYNPKLPIFWTMHDLVCVCPAYAMVDGNSQICEKCLSGDFSNCYKNKCIHGSTLMSLLSTYEANQIRKRKWYDKIDLYICPSNFHKTKLTQGNFTKSKIINMKNPLPVNTIYTVNESPKDYLLFFGRLSKEKGVEILIESMLNINYKLKILGTGPLEEQLKIKTKQLNLEDKIEFCGFKTGKELDEYVCNARAVLLPSQGYENGPYSAMEAMAKGKPLIVSNNGGLPELVEDGKNGYIFKQNSDLSNCIEKMLSLTNEEYLKMCKDSFDKARGWFNPDEYVRMLEMEVNK